jgi:hypothetical protein
MRVHKHNYDELFPQASMSLSTIVADRFAPIRHMYVNEKMVRYLDIQDIVDIMERRLKAPYSKSKELNQWRWIKMIKLSQDLIKQEECESDV